MSDDSKQKDNLFSTWRRATFDPGALYGGEAPERRRMNALVFAMIVSTVAPVVLAFAGGGFAGAVGAAVLVPLATIPSVYFSAALVHLWLILLRGPRGRFRDTAAAVGYAHAPLVFGVVPVLGTVVGYLWYLVVLAVGLRHVHRTAAWKAWLAVILGAGTPVILALGLRAGAVEAFKIPSGSMIPSLMLGDHVFVEKLTYGPLIPGTDARLYTGRTPERGDVMVFKFPENKEQDFIKRAIALPGDTLEAVNGRPIINGWIVPHCHVGAFHYENRTAELFVEFFGDRDYLTLFDGDPDEKACSGPEACAADGGVCRGGICGTLQGPFDVKPGEVWVMGDNRNNSHDSRSWRGGRGAGVPFENVKGRATIVWMSFAPGGGIVQGRIGVSVNGKPVLPPGHADLAPALEKCVAGRPSVAQTTPPPRGR